MRFRTVLAVSVMSVATLPHDVGAQEPTLQIVLQRAADYVARFKAELSRVVAEETYVQDMRFGSFSSVISGNLSRPVTHRELESDILLVRLSDNEGYAEFRDVYMVDGATVRDRQQRLARLFLDKSPGAYQQLEGILADSARYNIGTVFRNFNTPTLPLMFLEHAFQPRFTFKQSGDVTAISTLGVEKARLPATLWIVEYKEQSRDTIIRRLPGATNLASHGRFWIDPATGQVVLTELILDDPVIKTVIDVTYRLDSGLGLLVPDQMRERYDARHDQSIVEGRASYSRFRRFGVNTDEFIDTPR